MNNNIKFAPPGVAAVQLCELTVVARHAGLDPPVCSSSSASSLTALPKVQMTSYAQSLLQHVNLSRRAFVCGCSFMSLPFASLLARVSMSASDLDGTVVPWRLPASHACNKVVVTRGQRGQRRRRRRWWWR